MCGQTEQKPGEGARPVWGGVCPQPGRAGWRLCKVPVREPGSEQKGLDIVLSSRAPPSERIV